MLEINNTTKQKINFKKTQELSAAFLRAYKKPGASVSLALVGDAKIKSLNRDYRGIDKATDVLSFPAEKSGFKAKGYLGEIIINLQELARARKYKALFKELTANRPVAAVKKQPGLFKQKDYLFYFVLAHGLLHLIGYNDRTEAARQVMVEEGREFLEKFLV